MNTHLKCAPVGSRFDVTSQIGYNADVPGRSAGVARMVWDHEVGGSNPLAPILFSLFKWPLPVKASA